MTDKPTSEKKLSEKKKESKRLYFISQAIDAFYLPEHSYPKDHFFSIMQTLNICKGIRRPSLKELSNKRKTLSQKPQHKSIFLNVDKKTIVFDLDETLIHCNDTLEKPCDVVLPIQFDTGEIIKVILIWYNVFYNYLFYFNIYIAI